MPTSWAFRAVVVFKRQSCGKGMARMTASVMTLMAPTMVKARLRLMHLPLILRSQPAAIGTHWNRKAKKAETE
jgi:hypothetical protein